jgi:hypothetical protein
MNMLDIASAVIFLCFKHDGSLSSWGRTERHNKAVGGVDNSYHLMWMGVDVVLDVPGKNIYFEEDAEKFCLKAIWEGDHYHLQPA